MIATMIRYLLFLIFVLDHINGQDHIIFFMHCSTPAECQMSLETLAEKFEKCGGTKEAPKYMCPRVRNSSKGIDNKTIRR